MSLSFDQFRSAIDLKVAELQALPPTPQILTDIATLQSILAQLPPESA